MIKRLAEQVVRANTGSNEQVKAIKELEAGLLIENILGRRIPCPKDAEPEAVLKDTASTFRYVADRIRDIYND